MAVWVRFERGGSTALGRVEGGVVQVHEDVLRRGATVEVAIEGIGTLSNPVEGGAEAR